MEQLLQIYNRLCSQGYCSDKGTVHAYIEQYESILAPYREKAKNVLEIGVFHGHSLRLWEQYFTNAKVYGIDCSETPVDGMADLRPMIAEGTHNILIGDATSKADIDRFFGKTKFDIVYDDGSHQLEHQLKTIEIFKNRLTSNGVIIIEDIQDLDKDREAFESLTDVSVEVIDLRNVKNRYDDVIIIIRNK